MSRGNLIWLEQHEGHHWRCELNPGIAGIERLEVFCDETLVTAEATVAGRLAEYRAEILRQRVLRGDLRAPE